MDPASFVLVENIPASFDQKTLQSIISHVPCKGRVLSSSIINDPEGADRPFAQVCFEAAEDAEEAVRLWDRLNIDGSVVTAWNAAAPTAGITQGQTAAAAAKRPKKAARAVSALRYPFAPMAITWLTQYVNSLKGPRRAVAMCRILECFMCSAIAVNDPLMEHAVMQFYTKFPPAAWGKAQSVDADGVAFELCRQVFEVIGLVKKYPTANAKSKKMLLTLVERVVDDVSRVVASSASLATNKAIPEIFSSVRSNITIMRSQSELSDQSLTGLVSWLKFLFSCLCSHQNQVPVFPEGAAGVGCSEDCPCFPVLSTLPVMLLGDVEKVKIIDTFVTSAIREGNNDLATVAFELLDRCTADFCFSVMQHVQNGEYGTLRLLLFQGIRLATSVQGHGGHHPHALHHAAHGGGPSLAHAYNFIEATLHRLKETVARPAHAALRHLAGLVDNALVCLHDLRHLAADIAASAVQQLYTLQFDLTQLFNGLAAHQFALCLHPVPTAAQAGLQAGGVAALAAQDAAGGAAVGGAGGGAAAVLACASPLCDGASAELLKCSGCKAVYYCSTACQKADWKNHKAQCREIAARRSLAAGALAGGGTEAAGARGASYESVIVPAIDLFAC